MAGFYYFIADVSAPDLEKEGEWKHHKRLPALTDVTSIPDHACIMEVFQGPDGKAGQLVYPKTAANPDELPSVLGYHPDCQVWMPAGESVWIGWLKDEPPGPADLERRKKYAGYNVDDGCGRLWQVPIARGPAMSLPRDYVLTRDGVQRRVKTRFQALWDASGIVWDTFIGEKTVQDEWMVRTALAALAVNYRVDEAEVNAFSEMGLPLLDSDSIAAVLLVMADWQMVADHAKKNAKGPDSLSCSTGERDETQASGQVAAS